MLTAFRPEQVVVTLVCVALGVGEGAVIEDQGNVFKAASRVRTLPQVLDISKNGKVPTEFLEIQNSYHLGLTLSPLASNAIVWPDKEVPLKLLMQVSIADLVRTPVAMQYKKILAASRLSKA